MAGSSNCGSKIIKKRVWSREKRQQRRRKHNGIKSAAVEGHFYLWEDFEETHCMYDQIFSFEHVFKILSQYSPYIIEGSAGVWHIHSGYIWNIFAVG